MKFTFFSHQYRPSEYAIRSKRIYHIYSELRKHSHRVRAPNLFSDNLFYIFVVTKNKDWFTWNDFENRLVLILKNPDKVAGFIKNIQPRKQKRAAQAYKTRMSCKMAYLGHLNLCITMFTYKRQETHHSMTFGKSTDSLTISGGNKGLGPRDPKLRKLSSDKTIVFSATGFYMPPGHKHSSRHKL